MSSYTKIASDALTWQAACRIMCQYSCCLVCIHADCITGFKISGFTGDLGSAGFNERTSHSIIFKLTDGTNIKSDIQGLIQRNEPFEWEFTVAGEACIRRSNITQVYLKAGGNDGWYIREIYTYCQVEGNALYFPLNADPILYKWLDGDQFDELHYLVIYLNHSFISGSVGFIGPQESVLNGESDFSGLTIILAIYFLTFYNLYSSYLPSCY